MSNRNPAVDAFLEALEHPLKAEIEAVRTLILGSDERIGEQVKWNAPSFGYAGQDRVTMKLHPPKQVQIVLHRGAKVKDNDANARFEDANGLVRWVAADRGVITLRNMDEVERQRDALLDIVSRWLRETT